MEVLAIVSCYHNKNGERLVPSGFARNVWETGGSLSAERRDRQGPRLGSRRRNSEPQPQFAVTVCRQNEYRKRLELTGTCAHMCLTNPRCARSAS